MARGNGVTGLDYESNANRSKKQKGNLSNSKTRIIRVNPKKSMLAHRVANIRRTIRCNRAAKSGVLKWMIIRRRRLIGNVI
ncbi:hypothetical protein Q31a_11890 [Aureliella helgolandensis]|uniref:Uncharacterized protein n=1 Tax=Aureliella helgolandensis TaxID=2527968 RepID=A0A518G2R2_9BACT|nr:hypothetical protein Q31a_11890 [Aureliella helgolandensis]